jgi:hypothetical protein
VTTKERFITSTLERRLRERETSAQRDGSVVTVVAVVVQLVDQLQRRFVVSERRYSEAASVQSREQRQARSGADVMKLFTAAI